VLTCARCGAQNPDGNQFCQACGTPLTAVAAGALSAAATGTAPPLAYASPASSPVAYASPYYSPTGAAAQAPVHRTPLVLILSAVVALIVVMAGCGTAIALFGNRSGNQTNGTGIAAGLPSPSPGDTANPIASPISLTGPTASNAGETIPVPTGWVVDSKDSETITLLNPNGNGSVVVGSGPSNPPQSAQQNKDTLDKFFLGKNPDTQNCPNSKTTTGNLNGAPGIYWELCFTLVSGGQSFLAAAPLFAGANSNGSVYYAVLVVTSRDNLQSFINESAPILKGIQWKLQ
jgi:hypothetical protein